MYLNNNNNLNEPPGFYHTIINNVIKNLNKLKVDENIDDSVIMQIQNLWETKLLAANVKLFEKLKNDTPKKPFKLKIKRKSRSTPNKKGRSRSLKKPITQPELNVGPARDMPILDEENEFIQKKPELTLMNNTEKLETLKSEPYSVSVSPIYCTSSVENAEEIEIYSSSDTVEQKLKIMRNISPNYKELTRNEGRRRAKVKVILPTINNSPRECLIYIPTSLYPKRNLIIEPMLRKVIHMSADNATKTIQKYINQIFMATKNKNLKLIQTDGPADKASFRLKPLKSIALHSYKTDLDCSNISSDDDITDEEDVSQAFACDNTIFCKYKSVTKKKHIWRIQLEDGILYIDGKEYLFKTADITVKFY